MSYINGCLKLINQGSSKSSVALLLFIITCLSSFSANLQDNYPQVGKIEEVIFNKTFSELKIDERLIKLEKSIFGESYIKDSLEERTCRLREYILGDYENEVTGADEEHFYPNKKISHESGYENNQTKEITQEEFLEVLIEKINNERSFKGLIPLERDVIAIRIAEEQSIDLVSKGYLSYLNSKNQGPDERYTLSGGTGVTTELIKGFEMSSKENKIKLSELLADQLIQAIVVNTDDVQVLNNPYLTQIGCGFAVSKDKKKFVSTIELITKAGQFEPLKPQLFWGEKLKISGRINKPFKFKAISIGYEDLKQDEYEDNNTLSFDNENLAPYFPPQDYIAFGDKGKSNLLNVVKGLGVIGAIGAAPFTGGASAILAPALLSSIQNGQPKEIPLKGGIKSNSKGEFYGDIDLNYQGMSGLYYISILGELPGVAYPIIISRRTVRVDNILQPHTSKGVIKNNAHIKICNINSFGLKYRRRI